MRYCLPATVLLLALPHLASAQIAILHIRVLEGEGAIHLPASRSSRPLTVEITDEAGKPVEGAAVNFHLVEEGPGGTFANGLRTDVATTDAHGRATAHGLLWNHTAGRFSIQIVASKEQARAGMVSFQYIAESAEPVKHAPTVSRGKLKWVVIATLAGGAAAAAALSGGRSSTPPSPAAAAIATTAAGITIGAPSITVGRP